MENGYSASGPRAESSVVANPVEASTTHRSGPMDSRLAQYLENRRVAPWGQVMEVFWRLIASTIIKVLRRSGPAEAEQVDDLIQEVYVRLCADDFRIFRECRAVRPEQLFGLVQSVAATTTLDRYRSTVTERRGRRAGVVSIEREVLEDEADSSAEKQLEREVLIGQIDQHLRRLEKEEGGITVTPRDRHIFWLYYRHGFTAKDIAAIPSMKLSDKGVESVIHRLTSELRRIASDPKKGEKS